MKRVVAILVLLFAFIYTFSQSRMSVQSFKAVPNDMDARIHYPKKDQNGKVAALIKVITNEKGFVFDVGTLGVVDVDNNQVAETWVYVPRGVIRILIKHPQLGQCEYEFPIQIKEATVYKLTLSSNNIRSIIEEQVGGQYLEINVVPKEASLIVDNGTPISITNGYLNLMLPYGEHTYSLRSNLYKSTGGTVTIGDQKMVINETLEPDFGTTRD